MSKDKAPVALAIMTTRQDPLRPHVTNYRVKSAFVLAGNNDEAVGAGIRLGLEEWPASEGWQTPTVAVYGLTADEVLSAHGCLTTDYLFAQPAETKEGA